MEIYGDTVEAVFGAASRWCRGDRALAEDVVQETYLRAVRDWRRRGYPDRPTAWLLVVARNLLVSHLRKTGREIAEIEPAVAREAALEAGARRSIEELLTLDEGLGRIGGLRAGLLRAFHLEGRSVAEIARDTSLTERAVEGRLRRARSALARVLGKSPEESL